MNRNMDTSTSYLPSPEICQLALPGVRPALPAGETLTNEQIRGDWYTVQLDDRNLTVVELVGGQHFDFFRQGWDAWRAGQRKNANPLHRVSIGGHLWFRGWIAANREGKRLELTDAG